MANQLAAIMISSSLIAMHKNEVMGEEVNVLSDVSVAVTTVIPVEL
jgi:hypothetical protein